MARKASNQPTDVEIDILNVLWDRGSCTLGEIHETVKQRRDVAYSTTRKMTQVMREKGLIRCSVGGKPRVYSAAHTRKKTQKALINDLARRAFGGSAKELMLSLISTQSISDDELAEINLMIKQERQRK